MMCLSCWAETQNLIRYWASLNRDVSLLAELHQQRVLDEAEAVPDALGPEENGIEEVRVRVASMIKGLTRMEDERQIEVQCLDLGSHFEDFWNPMREWMSRVFLALQIESYRICVSSLQARMAQMHLPQMRSGNCCFSSMHVSIHHFIASLGAERKTA